MSTSTSGQLSAPISAEEVRSLSGIGEEVELPKGRLLSSLGSLMDFFYVLLDGELSVHRRGDDHQEKIVVRKEPAAASQPVLLSPPAIIDAAAAEPCRLLRFSADAYLQWVTGFSPA